MFAKNQKHFNGLIQAKKVSQESDYSPPNILLEGLLSTQRRKNGAKRNVWCPTRIYFPFFMDNSQPIRTALHCLTPPPHPTQSLQPGTNHLRNNTLELKG